MAPSAGDASDASAAVFKVAKKIVGEIVKGGLSVAGEAVKAVPLGSLAKAFFDVIIDGIDKSKENTGNAKRIRDQLQKHQNILTVWNDIEDVGMSRDFLLQTMKELHDRTLEWLAMNCLERFCGSWKYDKLFKDLLEDVDRGVDLLTNAGVARNHLLIKEQTDLIKRLERKIDELGVGESVEEGLKKAQSDLQEDMRKKHIDSNELKDGDPNEEAIQRLDAMCQSLQGCSIDEYYQDERRKEMFGTGGEERWLRGARIESVEVVARDLSDPYTFMMEMRLIGYVDAKAFKGVGKENRKYKKEMDGPATLTAKYKDGKVSLTGLDVRKNDWNMMRVALTKTFGQKNLEVKYK